MASNYSEAPDAKKPCKGILKQSSSFDKPMMLQNHRKSAKFDELNVLQTFHPADKDYGHMKIDEPKTPYRVAEGDDEDQLDAGTLAEKLQNVTTRSSFSDFDDSPDEEESEEQRAKRKVFEKRRSAHYNEFEAVRRARLLMQNDDEDDDDDNDDAATGDHHADNYDEDNDDDDDVDDDDLEASNDFNSVDTCELAGHDGEPHRIRARKSAYSAAECRSQMMDVDSVDSGKSQSPTSSQAAYAAAAAVAANDLASTSAAAAASSSSSASSAATSAAALRHAAGPLISDDV